jgi:predicted nucleic acid-binding protein
MLYLDSSALAKRYFRERGSKRLRDRLNRGDRVFTSELSYAEIHAVIARKFHERSIGRAAYRRLVSAFMEDWQFAINKIEVSATTTMSAIPDVLERFSLRGADAVHLAAAMWLRDRIALTLPFAGEDGALEFAVADQKLASVAAKCGLSVFNPETAE